MPKVQLRDINFKYPGSGYELDLNLVLDSNELIVLLGTNGSGKTTLVNLIAGFISPTSGEILIDDTEVTFLKPHERNLSVMFQDNNVIQHLTVRDNLDISLSSRCLSTRDKSNKIYEMASIASLDEYLDSKVESLSGGQQQRLGFAMCMAMERDLLILDEPFSSLDPETKEQFIHLIHNNWLKTKMTLLLVSHNYLLMREIASRFIFMDRGEIKFNGTLSEFENSDNPEVIKYLQSISRGTI